MEEDTIVAISSSLSNSAISIVRLSGKDAINIANKVFTRNVDNFSSHTINYGYIKDNDEIIDEVLLTIMKKPNTYTKEDIVEINTHGGIVTTNRVLELLINSGARLAEPGEFTKRAFLNGRIDLTQAESVMDIIESKTKTANKVALKSLTGKTKNFINEQRQILLDLISQIEVNIDYPEYQDIEEVTISNIKEEVTKVINNLEIQKKDSDNLNYIKNGINTLIIGKPNVGKSSLLNKLLDEDKAIVTDIEGTTRDIVEGQINLDGIILNLIDTAGIRNTDNKIEQIGIKKSLDKISDANLVIVVLDLSRKLSSEDKEILNKTKDKTRIIVLNKNDLDKKLVLEEDLDNVIELNTIEDKNIEVLKTKIKELFNLNKIDNDNTSILTTSRQITNVTKAINSLKEAINKVDVNPIDLIEIDIKDALYYLGEITGENYDEEILDNLFENFCVGK